MGTEKLFYTREHEWVRVDGNRAVVGVTDHAQHELGDVVFVELPVVGDEVNAGGGLAVVESVKAVSDVYAPLSGRVVAVNEELETSPELINEDAYGEGWIAEIELSEPGQVEELLSEAEYKAFLAEEQ